MSYFFRVRLVMFFIWCFLIFIFVFSDENVKSVFAFLTYFLALADSSIILTIFVIGTLAIYKNKKLQ